MDIALYKQTLKERGWTYRDLAQETGISLTNISRIMAGIVKDPRQSTIELIEKALGINVVHFTAEERAAGAQSKQIIERPPYDLSDRQLVDLMKLYEVMTEIQKAHVLGYIVAYLEREGVNVKKVLNY